jgi:hypothetical protein
VDGVITIDVRGLDGVQKRLAQIPKDLQGKAMSAAINKTAQKARAEINRVIPQEYAVKATEVRNSIDLRSARAGNLEAVISIFGSQSKRGRSANMIRFLAVASAAGITFKARGAVGVKKKDVAALKQQLGFLVRRGSGLKKIDGAFIGNKGRTVFIREGKGRLPIKPVQVIGFSQMFNARRINERVMAKIRNDFGVEMQRAIKSVLERNK